MRGSLQIGGVHPVTGPQAADDQGNRKHLDGIEAAVLRGVSNALAAFTNTKLGVLYRMAFGSTEPEHLVVLALLARGAIARRFQTAGSQRWCLRRLADGGRVLVPGTVARPELLSADAAEGPSTASGSAKGRALKRWMNA